MNTEEFVDRVQAISEEYKERQVLVELFKKAKAFGYKKVWIGDVDNPHWRSPGFHDFVIAEPPRKDTSRFGGWPAIWACIEHGCGNGLTNADQCQANVHFKYTAGVYDITGKQPVLVEYPEQEKAA